VPYCITCAYDESLLVLAFVSQGRIGRSAAATEGAIARIDFLLQCADMYLTGPQKAAHGVLYVALLSDCIIAGRTDIGKDIMASRCAQATC
jgi:hypothetical protein